jgi:penicillin-binding protein 1C
MRRGFRTRSRRWFAAAMMVPAFALVFVAAWIAWPLPADVAHADAVPSVTLLDRHGIPLRTTRSDDGSRGGWIPLDRIDPEIIQAFVAAEDRRFFEHHGVDARAVARALRDNARGGRIVSGASTLTMQAARLVRPIGRSWAGKAVQALWAVRLEAHLSKSRILETYLNRVPLGQGAIGIAAATRLYFDASPADVSLAQAATLAGMAHLPSRENPLVAPERARERRNDVLATMKALGFARDDDAARAMREPILGQSPAVSFEAPHFTARLLQQLDRQAVGEVRTTLDLDLQHAIEAEVRHTVTMLRERQASQAAAVVLGNRSGDVLAWVGSPDFFADLAGQVDMVVSLRQPGSALKPFLYGLAFDRGFTAASILPDVPRTYATSTGPYRPQNYDRRFRGPVRVRQALASSFNVPAVDLTDRLGAAALLETLHEAGFESLDRSPDHYGLGLALGNGEVTLLELANAYRGISNGGVSRPVRLIDRSESIPGPSPIRSIASSGEPGQGTRFMSSGAATLVLDILQDPVARIPGFGVETVLDFPFPAAAKTGTSRHFTDNWAVATTANFTVAVWVGNFSGRPMQGVSGITGAGPLLYRSVLQVAKRYAPGMLPTPEAAGAEPERICSLSGLRATASCPSMIEWFLPGTAPAKTDDWQEGGRTTLPPEYADWLAMMDEGARSNDEVPAHVTLRPDDVNRILSPLDGDAYEFPVGLAARYATLPLAASSPEGVEWRIDGAVFRGARWPLRRGAHAITARWPDGTRDSARITVK